MKKHVVRAGLRASILAAVFGGAPSTLYALARRRDPLEATAAVGSILLPNETRRSRLLPAAIPVHVALSVGWSIALAAVLPGRRPITEGTVAGLGIAAIDLGLVGPRYARIRALDTVPQVADHIAFGIIVARTLAQANRTM